MFSAEIKVFKLVSISTAFFVQVAKLFRLTVLKTAAFSLPVAPLFALPNILQVLLHKTWTLDIPSFMMVAGSTPSPWRIGFINTSLEKSLSFKKSKANFYGDEWENLVLIFISIPCFHVSCFINDCLGIHIFSLEPIIELNH